MCIWSVFNLQKVKLQYKFYNLLYLFHVTKIVNKNNFTYYSYIAAYMIAIVINKYGLVGVKFPKIINFKVTSTFC